MTITEAIIRRNNVTVGGRTHGPVMLFAHGFGCDQNMWRFVAPAFASTHRLVLFDYVGCGHSDMNAFSPTRYASLDGYARDVLEICAALDLHDVVFVGHSVSAMIGLLAGLREPARFSRHVMIAPSPRYINDASYVGGFERKDIEDLLSLMDHNYIGWASFLAPVVMANTDRPELVDELQTSFCSTDPIAARAFARATFYADNRDDLARAEVPSLIIQVRDDAIAPMAVGEYMHAHLPKSEMVVIDATGHCPHMSHPDLTLEAMQTFVERGRARR
jgi:sigma-B regulation protein RsbQ